jgi:hypothetical protein
MPWQMPLLASQSVLMPGRASLQCASTVQHAACACRSRGPDCTTCAPAGNLAVLAEQAMERARTNEQEALSQARSAEAARQHLAEQVEALERDKAAAQLRAGKLQQQLEKLHTELQDLQVCSGLGRTSCMAVPCSMLPVACMRILRACMRILRASQPEPPTGCHAAGAVLT